MSREREDIQKLKYNIQQYDNTKEKYEKIMFKEKILKLYNEMKDDRRVRSLGTFAEVERHAKRIEAYYRAKDLARKARKLARTDMKLAESVNELKGSPKQADF